MVFNLPWACYSFDFVNGKPESHRQNNRWPSLFAVLAFAVSTINEPENRTKVPILAEDFRLIYA